MSKLNEVPKGLMTPEVQNFIRLVESDGDTIHGDELRHIRETTVANGDELLRRLAALPKPQANMDSDTPGLDAALNALLWLVGIGLLALWLAIHFGFMPGM